MLIITPGPPYLPCPVFMSLPSLAFLKALVVTHQIDPVTYWPIAICRKKACFRSCQESHHGFVGLRPSFVPQKHRGHAHFLKHTLCPAIPSPIPSPWPVWTTTGSLSLFSHFTFTSSLSFREKKNSFSQIWKTHLSWGQDDFRDMTVNIFLS